MEAHGFIEVETPMMQPIAGGAVARPLRDASQHARYGFIFAHRALNFILKRLVVGRPRSRV